MRGFAGFRSLLRAFIVLYLSCTVNARCAKVSDLIPRVAAKNVVAPRFNGLEPPRNSFHRLKRYTRRLVDRCAETPVAACIGTSSLALSSAVWLGLVRAQSLISFGLPRSLLQCCLPISSVLLIPELNGSNMVNLVSFYMLLRKSELEGGSNRLLKRVIVNLVATTVVSGAFGTPPDFHKYSRAMTVTSALERPYQRVNFQGLLSLKQWQLPLALLLADYLMTLRVDQAVEGSKATIAGVTAYLLCNKL